MDDDTALYRRWLGSRDEGAFAALARRHAGLVVDVALRSGGTRPDAEDALQEALLALARDGSARPAQVGVRAWLARAAISRARHARSSARARWRREQAVGAQREEASMPGPTTEAGEAVRSALARLEPDDATVLSLRFLHGFEYSELAAAFEVSEPAARVRVHRALAQLRTEARRHDLDERALGVALAGLPHAGIDDGTMQSAIATALRPAGPVGSPLGLPRAWPVAAAAAVVGATVWFVGEGAPGPGLAPVADVATARGPEPGTDGVTLVGRTGTSTGDRDSGAPLSVAPGPARQAPSEPEAATLRPEPQGPAPKDASRPVALRLELAHANGSSEEIAIEKIHHRGNEWPGTALGREHVRVHPGSSVALSTSDPRSAVPLVTVWVPDPVPPLLVARMPAKGDPRLGRLVLEVVDARTGEPLPDAVLDWGEGAAGQGSRRADANGRIVVATGGHPTTADGSARHAEPALARFLASEHYVHAPGHRGAGRPNGGEGVLSLPADALEHWISTGEFRVALEPHRQGDGFDRRGLRVLFADGRPAEGAYVHLSSLTSRYGKGSLVVLQGGGSDGFRRLGADGLLEVRVRDSAAVGVRLGRTAIGVWGLSKEGWPTSVPRELVLPPLCALEVTLESLPSHGWWSLQSLGARRTPSDGSVFPQFLDGPTERLLGERDLRLLDVMPQPGGHLSAEQSTFSLPVIVGRSYQVFLDVGNERRRFEVRADMPGSLRLLRRWTDLPRDGER